MDNTYKISRTERYFWDAAVIFAALAMIFALCNAKTGCEPPKVPVATFCQ